uniref:Uncharacterized protein n=1 Tax=Pararge aegeria TaxID=116150 RepID=S4P070_9NEOP
MSRFHVRGQVNSAMRRLRQTVGLRSSVDCRSSYRLSRWLHSFSMSPFDCRNVWVKRSLRFRSHNSGWMLSS